MKSAERTPQRETLPQVSHRILRVFAAYSRRYLRRQFHSFRVLKVGMPPQVCSRPLVIFLNHAAWWDPLVCLLLSREFFPGRASFGPIDAAMLERYGFFRHLGFYGIDQESPRGALTFLRTSRALLASSRNAIWLTPQGRFMDVRERPLRLQEGLGSLAAHEPNAAFLPLAIEYAYWTEPRPEILVSFGEPIVPGDGPTRSAAEWTAVFTEALESSQDELAARSCRRDSSEWLTLDHGSNSVNGFYDAARWLRATMRGEKFVPEHQPDTER